MSWFKMKDKRPVCAGFYWFSSPGRKAQLVQVIDDFGKAKYRQLTHKGAWFDVNEANLQVDWAPARPPRAVEFNESGDAE